ncbi:PAS domain S-box-containing protein [Rhizobium sp. BK181]|uniref:sensor histidine kinase n=1 Tax=Rhizobium sp. BK181 TaxID=2587072 RepID=UPI0016220F4A|nr:PAS domain-containing sensor histidine kinase [Rhizobium sp. BK181]MBB3314988.1 PAS domain S-box-containing protein [Rhizobium sp. BK181]
MPKPIEAASADILRRQRQYRFVVIAIGALLVALGAVVIVAWIAQIQSILSVLPGFSSMALNTALCFALSGLGLISSVQPGQRGHMLAFLLFSLAAAMSGQRLIEILFVGNQAQIVERFLASLIVDPDFTARVNRGMAPNTAVIFFVASLSLAFALSGRADRTQLVQELVGYVVIGLGMAALAGYATRSEQGYQWGANIGMAVHTAAGLVLLGSAMLARSWWPNPESRGRMPIWLPAVVCLTGLFVDLYTPLGVANGILYVPLVLASLWFGNKNAPFSFAFACSVLVSLGFFAVDRAGAGYWYEATNRAITIATLWLVALLVFYFLRKDSSLNAERIRFDSVIRNTPNAVIAINAEGLISLFNPAAEKIFGYAAKEAIGQNVRLLMPEPYHSEHESYLARYARTGEKHILGTTRSVSGRRKGGEVFPLDLSVSRLATDTTIAFVGILRDISDRVAHEEQLKTMFRQLQAYTADLERSNADLDEFAYIASHDLKEPLRGLHNHSRFLLEDYQSQLDEDGTRRLNRLVLLSQRMEKLVNDLLYFSRIGRQQLAIKRSDVNAIVGDVVSTMELYLEERHAKVQVEGRLPEIVCDALRLTEVYRNLITNAVKYNDKPDPIVTIGHLQQFTGNDGTSARDVFFVRDNGKGIPAEFHEDIFRIFKRLEKPKDSDDGTGAGLTFVRKIIARHEGDIWLESEVGRGTTFYFTLGHKREDQNATA